ncbi:MAG: hypothetical protein ACREX8_02690, partial [Gammaproteobacteria bacterium]
ATSRETEKTHREGMKERGRRSPWVPEEARDAHLNDKGAPVSEEYSGRQIVGIDLHRRRSVLVRMTEAGQRLETIRISNDPEYLRQVMARAGEHGRSKIMWWR